MKEMFLYSDRLDKFQALGENGQAVHISALQLRETLRLRRHAAIADTLAIPQMSERGDRIDWYAPFSGDVIPWSAATESERQAALAQLDTHHDTLRQFSDELRQHTKPEQRLFGQLLEKAFQFPDQQHIWLVDGKPVITFWGFVNARHPVRIDPLDCLRPERLPTPAAAPVTPSAIPPVSAPVTRRGGWWWRLPAWLRWLFPLLLLILLILLLLRSCAPGVTLPGLATSDTHAPAAVPDAPVVKGTTGDPVVNNGVVGVTGRTAVDSHGVVNTDSGVVADGVNSAASSVVNPAQPPDTPHSADGVNATDPATAPGVVKSVDPANTADDAKVADPMNPADPVNTADPTKAADATNKTDPAKAADATTPVDPAHSKTAASPDATPVEPPVDPAVSGNTTANSNAGKVPLTLPPAALAKGDTQFFNGSWRVGSGIQDPRTGRPLSLNYQIKDGGGKVQMTRSDGVSCSGAVSTAIKSGQLVINNQGEAQCQDGSSYRMPEIQCAPGAQNIADCKGRYGEKTRFPISMKQEADK